MPFQPTSNLYIGTVPWDNTYRHVRYFNNREEQLSFMMGVCPNALRRNDYNYQRIDNSIVVPFNAETLYGYNYCMFQNENYGSRWFYSYITKIEYVNPEAARLYLDLDIFQTWFLDCTIHACNVEREHVNDDTLGAHIKDEGLNPGDLKVTFTAWDESNKKLYPVIASAAEPRKDGTYVNVGGDEYNDVYSGCSLTVFLEIQDMKDFINALADNGQQDAISAIYLVPEFCVQNRVKKSDGWGYWIESKASTPSIMYTIDAGIDNLDGYVPKNKKTLIYPNQYLEVTNFTGQSQKFRLEFFSTPGVATFEKTGGCSSASTLAYIPMYYNGNPGRSAELAVYMKDFPTCTWVYQSYANTMGQSRYDFPVVEGFDGNPVISASGDKSVLDMFNNFVSNITGLNLPGLAQDQYNTMAKLSQMTRMPNTSRGGLNSTTSLVNIGAYTVGFRKYSCRAEIARQIDDYYSAFGYLVSINKVPNVTGRRSWNYVKTTGCNVTGKVPPDALSAINGCFDRGVTFWHTNDVGNYALDNSIV